MKNGGEFLRHFCFQESRILVESNFYFFAACIYEVDTFCQTAEYDVTVGNLGGEQLSCGVVNPHFRAGRYIRYGDAAV